VSLDSVVYAFLQGESPEGIQDSYSALTMEQIFGSLAYYLANRQAIDEYLRQGEIEYDRLYEEARAKDPRFTQNSTRQGKLPSLIVRSGVFVPSAVDF
jgi:hypothetical protein